MDLVSAQQLGENLHRHEVALVILSACQSAALGDTDEPLGSVAVRLTAAGIPAVLAMTHSVLVATTRALFGEFYENLAKGGGIGEALDNARRHLKNLFDQVRFHPLSIRVLAQQLKSRRPAELGQQLEQLLTAGSAVGAPAATTDTPPELVASLQLSLDRLDDTTRQVLPRLGVFQSGAWEPVLLGITEIGEAVWPALRMQLEATALLEAEPLPGVTAPFLRFHPTLAPLLWAQLSADEQARLSAAHRQRYSLPTSYPDIKMNQIPSLLPEYLNVTFKY